MFIKRRYSLTLVNQMFNQLLQSHTNQSQLVLLIRPRPSNARPRNDYVILQEFFCSEDNRFLEFFCSKDNRFLEFFCSKDNRFLEFFCFGFIPAYIHYLCRLRWYKDIGGSRHSAKGATSIQIFSQGAGENFICFPVYHVSFFFGGGHSQ